LGIEGRYSMDDDKRNISYMDSDQILTLRSGILKKGTVTSTTKSGCTIVKV